MTTSLPPAPERMLVMACATVIEEMLPLMPPGMPHQVFDFGLHTRPAALRQSLQQAVEAASASYDAILLGYGLCSLALVGLRASACRLVAPRVDDCIGIFLGSRSAAAAQISHQPGTYYLTKGWIEAGDSPFSEYDRNVERYGQRRADTIYQALMGQYKRLALIDTGVHDLEHYRQHAQGIAQRFGLAFEEIRGSNLLVKKMLLGPWDDDLIILEPGETFTFNHFLPMLLGEAPSP